MRKWLSLSLAILICVSLFANLSYAAVTSPAFVSVVMDGRKIWFPDAQAFVDENGRTLVPVRFVAENMGAKVGWEADTMTVPIERGDKRIRLTVGENKAIVNGSEVIFDTKAVMKGGRTFVPLRFVSEVLGAKVTWDNLTATVHISTKENDTANYDEWGRLVRTANLPKNANDYPYILEDIPNEMYEFQYPHSRKGHTQVSVDIYKEQIFSTEDLKKIMQRVKNGFALKLNVDYETIDPAVWAEELFQYENQAFGKVRVQQNKEYAEWVKENKIKLEGFVEPEPSMLYNSGLGGWYVRARVRFKIDNYAEYKNIFHDTFFNPDTDKFEKGVWYEGYADIWLGTNHSGNYGDHLALSTMASLFDNSIIRKME